MDLRSLGQSMDIGTENGEHSALKTASASEGTALRAEHAGKESSQIAWALFAMMLFLVVAFTVISIFWALKRKGTESEDVLTPLTPKRVAIPKITSKPRPPGADDDYEDASEKMTRGVTKAGTRGTKAHEDESRRSRPHVRPTTRTTSQADFPGCTTEDCQKILRRIQSSVDKNLDPCSNFHSFVCDADQTGAYNAEDIKRRVLLQIRHQLDSEDVPANGQTAFQKSAAFYQKCKSFDKTGSATAIRGFLTEHGMDITAGMSFDPLAIVVRFMFVEGISLVFDVIVTNIYPQDSASLFLSLHEDFTSVPSGNEVRTVLSDIIQIEQNIVTNIVDARRNIKMLLDGIPPTANESFIVFPLSKLGEMTENDTDLSARWTKALLNSTDSRLPGDRRAIMFQRYVVLFHRLFKLNSEISENDLRLSFVWRTAQYLYGAALFRGSKPDEDRCFLDVRQKFPNTASSKFFFSVVNASRVDAVRTMFRAIIDELQDSFRNSPWMDDATRQGARMKVTELKKTIGYRPEFGTEKDVNAFYRDLPSMTRSYCKNYIDLLKFNTKMRWDRVLAGLPDPESQRPYELHSVSVAYSEKSNEIQVPPGVILEPTFFFGAPPGVNYGILGRLLMHALMHGFDETGRRYNAVGKMANWFSNASVAKYKRQTDCYEKLYRDGETKGLVTFPAPYADNRRTYLADTIGSMSVTRAYQKDPGGSTLGNVKDLTKDQLFYVSWCLLWCGTSYGDPSRCNLPLMNSQHFSDTFFCDAGSNMNPSPKCVFW